MGACIAAAVACAHAGMVYSREKRATLRYFQECAYCGRSPDRGQKSANCVGCGGPLKQSEHAQAFFSDDALTAWENALSAKTGLPRERTPTPEFETPEPFRPSEYVAPAYESPKSESYTPSPSPMSDPCDPANPIGIFSPIWNQD